MAAKKKRTVVLKSAMIEVTIKATYPMDENAKDAQEAVDEALDALKRYGSAEIVSHIVSHIVSGEPA
jgi:uncharacterized protein (UPF0297 family)